MKTAISLPDDLFDEIDACARKLKLTRSGLLARAARQFVDKSMGAMDATSAWNDAIEKAGQPIDDPSAKAFQRRTKQIVASGSRGRH